MTVHLHGDDDHYEGVDEQQFLRNCFGVVLRARSADDPHIAVYHCEQDDDNWYLRPGYSSHWIDEMIDTLRQAKAWMQEHAEPEKTGHGYMFKTRQERSA